MKTEELGIDKEVGFGLRDVNSPVLWMEIKLYAGGFLDVMSAPEALKFIVKNDVTNINNLKGGAVVVESENRSYKVRSVFKP